MKRILSAFTLFVFLLYCCKSSEGAVLYGLTGRGGTPKATLHVVSQSDASLTPVMQLNDNGGGQVIAYNPDDGHMYHWTGYPSSNTLLEKINLETLAVTNIPLSGFETNEIYSATYDPTIGAFLTTDLSVNFASVTPDGVRTYLGSTDHWVRGLAFVGETLYGGRNTLIPVDSLFTIDPSNGDLLSTTSVTLEGYTLSSFISQATNPDTGELWALLIVEELPRKTRVLVTIEPATGVATLVGIMPEDSGFSSIAFVPDPVIPVEIDVKPGDELNPLNTGSNGVIPVAIFSSEDFDASTIDPISISLEGAEVAVRGKGKLLAHEEDVNGDGLLDLVCQVETESLAFDLEVGEVCLTGKTTDGQKIAGCDLVVVVPDLE
ncbi:MAG: hypothetical protein HUJ26_08000 [Planctomycetaceae bacterium]|nr:hypothetical protein [Planctomycetaceae bacterium]